MIANDHDDLTGLPGPRAFWAAASEAVSSPGVVASVLAVELDGLAAVNASGGNAAGDAIVVRLARSITDRLSSFGFASRLHGDVFAVLLPGLDAAGASVMARDFASCWAASAGPSLSFGIATYPKGVNDGRRLVMAAESALIKAASLGGKCVVEYDPTAPVAPGVCVQQRLPCRTHVSRDAETTLVLNSVGAGRGATFSLTGPDGVGKSRFLRELRGALLSRGLPAMFVAPSPGAAGGDPFQSVRRALSHLSSYCPWIPSALASAIGVEGAGEVLRFGGGDESARAGADLMRRSLAAVRSVAPLVILVDDAELLPDEVVDLLLGLASRDAKADLVVACDERTRSFRFTSAAHVEFEPLALEEAARLLWTIAPLKGVESFGADIVHVSSGLPGTIEDAFAHAVLTEALRETGSGWQTGAVSWGDAPIQRAQSAESRAAMLPRWATRILAPAFERSMRTTLREAAQSTGMNLGHVCGAFVRAARLNIAQFDGPDAWVLRSPAEHAAIRAAAGDVAEAAPERVETAIVAPSIETEAVAAAVDSGEVEAPLEFEPTTIEDEAPRFGVPLVEQVPPPDIGAVPRVELPLAEPPIAAPPSGATTEALEVFGAGLQGQVIDLFGKAPEEPVLVTDLHMDEETGVIVEIGDVGQAAEEALPDWCGAPGDEGVLTPLVLSGFFEGVQGIKVLLQNLRFFTPDNAAVIKMADRISHSLGPALEASPRVAIVRSGDGVVVNGASPGPEVTDPGRDFAALLSRCGLDGVAIGRGFGPSDLVSLIVLLNERSGDPPDPSSWPRILTARGIHKTEVMTSQTAASMFAERAGASPSDGHLSLVSPIDHATSSLRREPTLEREAVATGAVEESPVSGSLVSDEGYYYSEASEQATGAYSDSAERVVGAGVSPAGDEFSSLVAGLRDTAADSYAAAAPAPAPVQVSVKPLAAKQLIAVLSAVRMLKMSVHNCKLFSPQSRTVASSVERGLSSLAIAHAASDRVTLAADGEAASINGAPVADEAGAREVNGLLGAIGATAISFDRGIDVDEAIRFLGVVTSGADGSPSWPSLFARNGITHITVARSGQASPPPPPPPPDGTVAQRVKREVSAQQPVAEGADKFSMSELRARREELDTLITALATGDPDAHGAMEAFVARHDKSALPLIVMAIAVSDEETFREAAGAVYQHAAKDDVKPLLDMLDGTKSSREKSRIASVLYRWDKPEVQGELIDLMRFPDPVVRRSAEEALSKMEGKGLNDRLMELISPADDLQTAGAIAVLKRRGHRQVVPRVMEILERKSGWSPTRSPAAFRESALAVGTLGHKAGVLVLIDLLKKTDDERVMAAAIWALGNVGTPTALDALREYEGDPRDRIARAAQAALTRTVAAKEQ